MGTMWVKLVLPGEHFSKEHPPQPHSTPKLEEKALTASSLWPKAGSPTASPTRVLPASSCSLWVVGNGG